MMIDPADRARPQHPHAQHPRPHRSRSHSPRPHSPRPHSPRPQHPRRLRGGRSAALRLLATLAGAAFFLGACSDEGPVSGPGTMTATLVGPNGAEGAAVISLLGDGIGSVSGVGNTAVHARSGDSELRLVLIDQMGGDLSFEVAVPDTTQPPAVVIHEVAGPDDALRPTVDGYSVEFVR